MHVSCHLNNNFGKISNNAENFDHTMKVRFKSQIIVADYAWHVLIVLMRIICFEIFFFISRPLPHAAEFDIVLFVF